MHYINILKQEHSSAKIYKHNLFDKRSVVDRYRCHVAGKFGLVVGKDPGKRHLLYWIPKLHTIPYKLRLLLNLNSKQICIHLLTVRLTSDYLWKIEQARFSLWYYVTWVAAVE